jgi:hypothetical protein
MLNRLEKESIGDLNKESKETFRKESVQAFDLLRQVVPKESHVSSSSSAGSLTCG